MSTAEIMSIVFSGSALAISAISSLVAPWINNKHELKMFEKEFYEKRRCEVIENYLKCVGDAYFNKGADRADIAEWMSEIYMYAPEELWDSIDEMNQILIDKKGNAGHSEDLQKNYVDFCKKFSNFGRNSLVGKHRRKAKDKHGNNRDEEAK